MANKHVRSGASGTGSGDDWTNAYTALPAALSRDDIYYIGVGSYSGYVFDDAEDGTNVIIIRKATIASHGSATGWNDAYAAQADFNGTFRFERSYYTVDGVFRDENSWNTVSAYGIKCDGALASTSISTVGHHITINRVSLLRAYSLTYVAGDERLYLGGFTETITNWSVSGCMMGNSIHTIVQLAGASDMVIEDCYLGASWGKEAIRGQIEANNIIIRNNTFFNSTQIDPEDPTSGITGEIAFFGDEPSYDGNQVYGNTFYNEFSGGRNTCVAMGGMGFSAVANNCKVYNNTFAGVADSSVFSMVLLSGGSGNEAKNNLFYDCASTGVTANSTATNVVASLDPFADFPGFDFNITDTGEAYEVGTDLGAGGWTPDRNGTARGVDGTWSVGAFEFDGGGPPPENITLNVTNLTIGTLTIG
jgi:hypothetical protein